MATISENLQTKKNSTNAIKQAIIDKGGTVNGDITTWADAIMAISTAPSTITFTIRGSEYQAEEGMTWGEWVDSGFNVNDFYINAVKGKEEREITITNIYKDFINEHNKNINNIKEIFN